ncbi:hypothetical protein WICPIJ_008534 [Wickerhamomyces pijperi]|uniref:Uncharacterized protein n=1 Tax=Wickerhamomyces pijperi TaxID=599730 RepID=A0A9P8PYC0_WICPI|nr:hypothetical protein WICPIJ_008534 [Wickerhamomyces pijperi]
MCFWGHQLSNISDLLGFVEHFSQDLSTAVIVQVVILDKGKAIDIDDVALATNSKKIKPTDRLAKARRDSSGNSLLFCGQVCDVSDFLSVGVSSNNTINNWRLSCFSVTEGRSNSIGLDIFKVVCVHKLLIDIRPCGSWLR